MKRREISLTKTFMMEVEVSGLNGWSRPSDSTLLLPLLFILHKKKEEEEFWLELLRLEYHPRYFCFAKRKSKITGMRGWGRRNLSNPEAMRIMQYQREESGCSLGIGCWLFCTWRKNDVEDQFSYFLAVIVAFFFALVPKGGFLFVVDHTLRSKPV